MLTSLYTEAANEAHGLQKDSHIHDALRFDCKIAPLDLLSPLSQASVAACRCTGAESKSSATRSKSANLIVVVASATLSQPQNQGLHL